MKINKTIGRILVVGIIITQIIITLKAIEIGRMAPLIAFLTFIIFIPYFLIALISLLDREKRSKGIRVGIAIGVFFQVALPTILPLFFDKEFIYLSFVGVVLGVLMWFYRNKIEVQLLVFNIIGLIVWLVISLGGVLAWIN